jgi:predicted small integral membrane protein
LTKGLIAFQTGLSSGFFSCDILFRVTLYIWCVNEIEVEERGGVVRVSKAVGDVCRVSNIYPKMWDV